MLGMVTVDILCIRHEALRIDILMDSMDLEKRHGGMLARSSNSSNSKLSTNLSSKTILTGHLHASDGMGADSNGF
jgi:hypothetical protein